MNGQMRNLCFDPPSGGARLPEGREALLLALDHIFLSVVKLELDTGKAWLLHSKGQPDRQPHDFDWNTYLGFYRSILQPEEAEKLTDVCSTANLRARWQAGKRTPRLNLSCRPETGMDWLEIIISFLEDADQPAAYVFTRQSGDNYLLRRIIDLYIYNNCDCFIYLDAKNNSYTMFSGNGSGTPLPPAESDDYVAEVARYVQAFVPPEDQETVLCGMSLERVMEELEHREVYAFNCGMWDARAGYSRKRMEYRYFDRSRQIILLTRTDVTAMYEEQQRNTQALRDALRRAQIDPLTGLWNYQGIQEAVKKEMEHFSGQAALFFLDLDDFKLVNDRFGHAEGDRALQAVAEVLRHNIRTEDHASRIGGDEFVVFLGSIRSREAARRCAQRILEQLSQVRLEHSGVRLSGSLGIALAPEDGFSYDELVKEADTRLYRAKSNGKNQIAF